MVQEKDQLTNKNQAQSSKDIGNRVADIDFWKSELRHETDLLVGETNALTEVIHILLFTVFFGVICFMNLASTVGVLQSYSNHKQTVPIFIGKVLET